MSVAPWTASHADPRRAVHVSHARVRVTGDDASLSALGWQQRVEDALRCTHFGTGQRVVLLRKLRVSAASAQAPGWAGVVEAACQDAVARACGGRSPGAEHALAVWFHDWDDAIAAWLDAAMCWPGLRVSPTAWFWPRIAKLAGLVPRSQATTGAVAAAGFRDSNSVVPDQARAMWARWQDDPASRRASARWLAERPAFRDLLQPAVPVSCDADPASRTAAMVSRAQVDGGHRARANQIQSASREAAAVANAAQDVEPGQPSSRPAAPPPRRMGDTHEAANARRSDEAAQPARHLPRTSVEDAASPVTQAQPTDWASDFHAPQPAALGKIDEPAGLDAATQAGQTVRDAHPGTAVASEGELPNALRSTGTRAKPSDPQPAPAAVSALGWSDLRHTELGGLPLTFNALQRLGFVDALDGITPLMNAHDHAIAVSAPWLAVWSHLSPANRQRWVHDPMFAVLPAFDLVASVPSHTRADALLTRWQAQVPAVHRLGRQAWRGLQRAGQGSGWRSPRALLQRPAWMQLSATHLDVIFALDQADLAVRRLGLDVDPGWVPWLGRIVSLHFEPADRLPHWSPR